MREGSGKNGGAHALIDSLEGKTVLVVGDIMVDEYITGAVDRISPEAPVPVVDVRSRESRLGGAANVTHNLKALGARAMLAGVVGDDALGVLARTQLEAEGVLFDGVLTDPSRPTTVKTRVIAQKQQIVRYDQESRAPLGDALTAQIVDLAISRAEEIDAVVLSDYAKGVLGHGLGGRLIEAFRTHGKPILADPKIKNFGAYRGASVITPNFKEAVEAAAVHAGMHVETQEQLEKAAGVLLEKMECQHLVVTQGARGMYLFSRDQEPVHIPTAARDVFDVSGAGDTVIATLALAMAAGATLSQAAVLANHAAGVVVGKFGTATVSLDELRAVLGDPT